MGGHGKSPNLGYDTRVLELGMGFSTIDTTYWRRKHWTSLFASVTYIGAEVVHISTRTNLDLISR